MITQVRYRAPNSKYCELVTFARVELVCQRVLIDHDQNNGCGSRKGAMLAVIIMLIISYNVLIDPIQISP